MKQCLEIAIAFSSLTRLGYTVVISGIPHAPTEWMKLIARET